MSEPAVATGFGGTMEGVNRMQTLCAEIAAMTRVKRRELAGLAPIDEKIGGIQDARTTTHDTEDGKQT